MQNTWQDTEDEELNNAIANSTEEDLSEFLQNLDEEETEEILERNTMLNNTITEYEAEETNEEEAESDTEEEISNQIIVNTETYYQYLLTASSSSAASLSSKTGYFFIQISGNGKTTKRKVSVTLNSTSVTSSQTVKFSEVAVSGYSDNHEFTITTASSKTKATSDLYTILTMQFSYKKPAHYYAGKDYSDKVDGYRFNFSAYTEDNSGSSTVNNTGHNTTDTTEYIDLQINVANCGIGRSGNYTPSNATGYITLSKNYYSALSINPNGGTHGGKTSTYTYGTKVCGTTATIANPTRSGYKFTGWTLSKGSNCGGASFNTSSNVFTYCGKSTSSSSAGTANTCTLTANWQEITGTVTITSKDTEGNVLQGSEFSIYNSSKNLLYTGTSSDSGTLSFSSLPIGTYYIYQTGVVDGYKLNSTEFSFSITESQTSISITVINEKELVLPEAGGIEFDLIFISLGLSLIILTKTRRNK